MKKLVANVRKCTLCDGLPLGPKPIFQAHESAKILIVGQAPGRRAHESGIPFDDPSGDRLRLWLGVDKATFYDATKIALLPMGFCYPGTGKGGDLPPRPECAPAWREQLLAALPDIEFTLVIGMYAQKWHLGDLRSRTLTETVSDWQQFWPDILPLPHPSPRNIRWFRQNAWFEDDILPKLAHRVASILEQPGASGASGDS